MTIAEREQQILRVRRQGVHPELEAALAEQLQTEVMSTVKQVLEGAIGEEVTEFLQHLEGKKPYPSGFYERQLHTQYGYIEKLQVPRPVLLTA